MYRILPSIMLQADGPVLRSRNWMLPHRQMPLAGWHGGVSNAVITVRLALIDSRLTHFAKLGVTTATTFVVMFAPWLRPFPGALLHVLHRIFPFARGIFEDKVGNFWCASNVVVKWKNWFSMPGMARVGGARVSARCR